MRYVTNLVGAVDRFGPGSRPPIEAIPTKLADLIREIDRLSIQRSEAETRLRDLEQPHHDTTAQRADGAAATAAARAAERIPEPKAIRQLEDDRAAAKRAYDAHVAALADCIAEADRVAEDNLYPPLRESRHDRLTKARAKLEAQAHKLADQVESVVREDAVAEWMRSGVYQPKARTWQSDIVDLERFGIDRRSANVVDVRDVLVSAVRAVLEDPEAT